MFPAETQVSRNQGELYFNIEVTKWQFSVFSFLSVQPDVCMYLPLAQHIHMQAFVEHSSSAGRWLLEADSWEDFSQSEP